MIRILSAMAATVVVIALSLFIGWGTKQLFGEQASLVTYVVAVVFLFYYFLRKQDNVIHSPVTGDKMYPTKGSTVLLNGKPAKVIEYSSAKGEIAVFVQPNE